MHTILRDRYKRLGLILDLLLLAASVIFAVTTFARDELFVQLGFSPDKLRYLLGLASVAAFFASLVAMIVDWKGKAVRHQDAVQRLTSVVAQFRKCRQDDGTWPPSGRDELHHAYWEAMANTVEVPARSFISLKAKHLRKVELSKLLDSRPGCPILILRVIIGVRSIFKARTNNNQGGTEQ
jgi:hypothetical protein